MGATGKGQLRSKNSGETSPPTLEEVPHPMVHPKRVLDRLQDELPHLALAQGRGELGTPLSVDEDPLDTVQFEEPLVNHLRELRTEGASRLRRLPHKAQRLDLHKSCAHSAATSSRRRPRPTACRAGDGFGRGRRCAPCARNCCRWSSRSSCRSTMCSAKRRLRRPAWSQSPLAHRQGWCAGRARARGDGHGEHALHGFAARNVMRCAAGRSEPCFRLAKVARRHRAVSPLNLALEPQRAAKPEPTAEHRPAPSPEPK